MDAILKWTKQFLEEQGSASRTMRIVRDYFVVAGSTSKKQEHLVCNVVLPENVDVTLRSFGESEQVMVQKKVMDRLRHEKGCWLKMAEESGIPMSLFEQIAFGITDLLPSFVIRRVMEWTRGSVVEEDQSIKEDPVFAVRVE